MRNLRYSVEVTMYEMNSEHKPSIKVAELSYKGRYPSVFLDSVALTAISEVCDLNGYIVVEVKQWVPDLVEYGVEISEDATLGEAIIQLNDASRYAEKKASEEIKKEEK